VEDGEVSLNNNTSLTTFVSSALDLIKPFINDQEKFCRIDNLNTFHRKSLKRTQISLTMSSPNLTILSNTDTDTDTDTDTVTVTDTDNDTDYVQRVFTVPFPSKRKCVFALYCLICSIYIAEEARRPTSSTHTRDSRSRIVTITVTPSLSSSSSFSDHHSVEVDVGNISERYDAMPAFFGRPPEDHTTKTLLINFNFDDGDDTLCPNTDPLSAGKERSMEYLNIWPFAHVDKDVGVSIGNSAISLRLNGHDSNSDSDKCLTAEPVALLASRGKCSFEAKAIQALTNPPPLFDRKGHQDCPTDISYLIIYDNQPQELENEQIHENNDRHTISSAPLVRMSSTDNKVKDDMPISLLFVSYETGMALKQKIEDLNPRYMQSDGSSNDADFDKERGLILTLNAGRVESKQRRHHFRKPYNNNNEWMDGSNNDDANPGGNVDDFYNDDFYDPTEDPGRILFEQMVTAMSLMFSFIFCIGCMMLCCCHPDDDGENGWFTVHFDRRGFVFGRPDDGESVARLLTEEEILSFPEVEFGERNSDDSYNVNSNDLEVGKNEGMDAGKSTTAFETMECSLSPETPLIGESLDNADTDNETSSPKTTLPLQRQTCSLLNNDSLSFNAMCSICLEEYEPREKLRVLPCQHMFHTECIIPWLTERFPNCPLCKAQIIPVQTEEGNEHLNEDDDEVVTTREHGDANNTNEVETNGEVSSAPFWRNFLFGSLSHPLVPSVAATASNVESELSIHYNEREERAMPSEDNIMSSLSMPLLQDSRSPASNSPSELTVL